MFIAKFNQTTGAPFVADKNTNMPFIGTIVAGQSNGSIINGTMFKREGLIPNKLYLCDNSVDPEYPDNVQTDVISEVSLLEFKELRAQLGAPKNTRTSVSASTAAEVSVEA